MKKTFKLNALVGAALALVACSDAGPRVYTAQPYDAEASCLGEYEAIGLVEADGLSAACAAVCLDVAGSLYLSTVCPPYPDTAAVVDPIGNDACAAALEATACEEE